MLFKKRKINLEQLKPYQRVILILLPSLLLLLALIAWVASMVYVDERDLKIETAHIELYSTKRDLKVSKTALVPMENAYATLLELMDFQDKKNKVKLMVFPSYKEYADFMFPLNPKWRDTYAEYATAEGKNVKVVSPKAKDLKDYSPEAFVKLCQYQLALDVLNQNRYNIEKVPMWLTQGLGMYISTTPEDLEGLNQIIKTTKTPDYPTILGMAQGRPGLYNQSKDAFGETYGKEYSYKMIAFVLENKGETALQDIFDHPELYLEVLGYESNEALMSDFESYLR